jgi:CDP-glucose 4,6-dehydratase
MLGDHTSVGLHGDHFLNMPNFEDYYRGKKVAVTGHTGFTGGWLCTWLQMLGAEVCGLSLEPESQPNIFSLLELEKWVSSRIDDICVPKNTKKFFSNESPDIVFHLAAQPLVGGGYKDPHLTFNTNVMGTLNILEAARNCLSTKAVVCITTDKVYKNEEWHWGYRETDQLGGKDPYSASKSAAEMVIQTYQLALAPIANDMLIACARGGNIIGGGDWAEGRIVPDFIRAHQSGDELRLRSPSATRPWQHVLALVHGYLILGGELLAGNRSAVDSWNFGPGEDGEQTVLKLVETMGVWLKDVKVRMVEGSFEESHFLHLNSEKSRKLLKWRPPLDFNQTVEWTALWYDNFFRNKFDSKIFTGKQVAEYRQRLV